MGTGTLRVLTAAAALAALAASASATSLQQETVWAADRLVAQQAGNGSWAGEEAFTGEMVAGLVNAYQVLGNSTWETAAVAGGTYIINYIGPNYYGNSTYALTRLSQISATPGSNVWRTAASGFYAAVKSSPGGTTGYISGYSLADPSVATYYLAHHTLAAFYVNADDKALWRNGLISFLGTVSDSTAAYPVMALGAATWALAQTGPLDGTVISTDPTSYFYNVTLAQLPGLLEGDQVSSGLYAGSFYWGYAHTAPLGGYVAGYTEDTVFGALGLEAIGQLSAFSAAQDVLGSGVHGDGQVYEHIWAGTVAYNVFAGETLQVIPELSPEPIPEPNTVLGLTCASVVLLPTLRRRLKGLSLRSTKRLNVHRAGRR